MYLEKPLQQYLDDIASSQSTPGGGSASALSGAIGAGLASMVARLTLGKADYINVQQEVEALIQKTEQLRTRFQQLIQEDIDAYGRLSACFKMPRTTDEERATRTQAIQARLAEAALVPLEVTECAAELLHHCQRIAEIGNKTVLSDIATSTMLVSSAGTGASWMVRTNLLVMKDLALVDTLSDRLNTALDTIAMCSQQVITLVGEKA
ncbi:MAG: cyclodeaminase/cyclohydrolase family protein [Ktedonobacteraceae bacterium]